MTGFDKFRQSPVLFAEISSFLRSSSTPAENGVDQLGRYKGGASSSAHTLTGNLPDTTAIILVSIFGGLPVEHVTAKS
jgi:hypothetical protein